MSRRCERPSDQWSMRELVTEKELRTTQSRGRKESKSNVPQEMRKWRRVHEGK